ncbi:lipid-A-disaccharide kinase [Mesonia phycicola]|uniref:Tetraacyldisaccharide 4'-kinase n=1 Tax=Mesonia phycicola TaxID=579105 RepID=A0A1M6F972_9FLAO|nr:tetraacyldisaccharide 4'-kinase [Mesonia phycicola]SHI94278.1 lipid-A-disaccharide kinase [Mesonia phycicola]
MKMLRKLLLPFSLIYGFIVWLRNKLYDWEIKKSAKFTIPVICVGNLSVGGTGKSPMIEHLIKLLKDKHNLATLSRGYKRESKGFYILSGNETAAYVGDEPLQFKSKFSSITVAVDEQRKRGIENLLALKNTPDVVLLDDAFQHRKVTPSHSILLTSYNNLYCNDYILPAGNLREPKSGAKRANIIVVTKCPKDLSDLEMNKIKKKLKPLKQQKVFFSSIKYANEVINHKNERLNIDNSKDFSLVTGIANPTPLLQHLEKLNLKFNHLNFPDHYNFKEKDLQKIKQSNLVITTEKDFMRLKNEIDASQLYYLPIEIEILKDNLDFENTIKSWLQNY